jgi:hypothetical protein
MTFSWRNRGSSFSTCIYSALFVPAGRLTLGRSFTACGRCSNRFRPSGTIELAINTRPFANGFSRPDGTGNALAVLQAVNDLPKFSRLYETKNRRTLSRLRQQIVNDLPKLAASTRRNLPQLYSLKVIIALCAVIPFAAQAAFLETGDRNRRGTGRCVRAFRSILSCRELSGGPV